MPRCHHCRRDVEAGLLTCPHCRAELPAEPKTEWTSVARVNNLAEAGYFADRIDEAGFPIHVREHDQFSAVDGSWSTVFYLQVPEEYAESAAELIEQELSEYPVDESFQYSAETIDDYQPAVWRPLVLMLLAGGLAYWAGNGMVGQRARPERRSSSLWDVLREIDRPLVSQPGRGGERFRLEYDRFSDVMYLYEDVDGDGTVDRKHAFRDGQLVPQPQ